MSPQFCQQLERVERIYDVWQSDMKKIETKKGAQSLISPIRIASGAV